MDQDQNNSINEVKPGGSKTGKITGVVVGLVVVGAVAFFLLTKDSGDSASSNSSATNSTSESVNKDINAQSESKTTTSPSANDQAGAPTKEQVALHDKKSDCWTIVSGKVYDITSYVPRHPGGDEILRACGTDGTSLFETRTTADGQKVDGGGSHSSTAESQLKQLEIGTLAR